MILPDGKLMLPALSPLKNAEAYDWSKNICMELVTLLELFRVSLFLYVLFSFFFVKIVNKNVYWFLGNMFVQLYAVHMSGNLSSRVR